LKNNKKAIRVTTVLFVRHGESQSNVLKLLTVDREKYSLTDSGRRQVEKLSIELSLLPIKKVYTSPLLRAVETAAIISNALDVSPKTEELLMERDHGKANETTIPSMEDEIELYSNLEKFDIEKLSKIAERVMKFLDSVDLGGTVIAVTHADVIRAALARLLKIDEDEFSSYALVPEKASITAFRRQNEIWKIVAIGAPLVTTGIRQSIED
jgi:2,3-bisphosphoglycerate-dependent phosphoglycerate mutase